MYSCHIYITKYYIKAQSSIWITAIARHSNILHGLIL